MVFFFFLSQPNLLSISLFSNLDGKILHLNLYILFVELNIVDDFSLLLLDNCYCENVLPFIQINCLQTFSHRPKNSFQMGLSWFSCYVEPKQENLHSVNVTNSLLVKRKSMTEWKWLKSKNGIEKKSIGILTYFWNLCTSVHVFEME